MKISMNTKGCMLVGVAMLITACASQPPARPAAPVQADVLLQSVNSGSDQLHTRVQSTPSGATNTSVQHDPILHAGPSATPATPSATVSQDVGGRQASEAASPAPRRAQTPPVAQPAAKQKRKDGKVQNDILMDAIKAP